jgi:hypothetical protein
VASITPSMFAPHGMLCSYEYNSAVMWREVVDQKL